MEKEILEILKLMQQDIKSVKEDIKLVKEDIKSIKVVQDEHTQLLRALEHRTEVISAEQENLKHELAEVKGEVKGIRKDLSNVEMITASNWSDIAKLKAVK